MIRKFNFRNFCQFSTHQKNNGSIKGLENSSYGSLTSISAEKKRSAIEAHKKYKDNLPAVEMG